MHTNHAARIHRLYKVLIALIVCARYHPSSAAILNLVGFDLYSSTSTGASSDDPIPGGYRWSSNSSEGGDIARQKLTETSPVAGSQTEAISFPLVLGGNIFTFAPDPNFPPGGTLDPGPFAGVNLFFNDTGTSFNPSGTGIAGNLAAFSATNTSSPPVSNPASGVLVDDYGPGINVASYDDATSFVLDGMSVTVTALAVTSNATGSMTITVTTLPEPASLSLIALGIPAILARRRATRNSV